MTRPNISLRLPAPRSSVLLGRLVPSFQGPKDLNNTGIEVPHYLGSITLYSGTWDFEGSGAC